MAALDRAIALTPAVQMELARPAKVVQAALESGNGDELFDYLRTLRQVGQVSGINLAQTLYLISENWTGEKGLQSVLNIEDEMADVIASRVGVSVQTVKKYIRTWSALHGKDGVVPAKHKDAVMAKPWEWQMLLPAAAPDLTPTQWKKFVMAQNKNDVRDIVQIVRGRQTSGKSAAGITLRRNGKLEGFQGTKKVNLGLLNIESSDPLVQMLLTRLIKGAGIKLE